MAVIVGIDEAGYGPILGPLVVSAAIFDVPDNLISQSLWQILQQSVCKNRQGAAGRLIINDSKKLHHGLGDNQLLQRGVLTALHAIAPDKPLPKTLTALMKQLQCPTTTDYSPYPWYHATFDNWPLNFNAPDINTAAAGLTNDMKKQNIRLLELWSQPLPVGKFNEMIDAVKNKATVLFTLNTALIHRAFQLYAGAHLQIIIDKHGGRSHYRSNLQRAFPDCQMKILKESDATSSYQLTDDQRTMKIHFIARGDDRQLPISLASMTGKYLRELFMEILNHYFQKLCPNLKPTAGYYTDGRRFLNDLKSHQLPHHQTPPHLLIRNR